MIVTGDQINEERVSMYIPDSPNLGMLAQGHNQWGQSTPQTLT